MSWAIGFDSKWNRDIGYGVPATCDHPDCNVEIDRGLAYVCGGEPYGGERGCGLYFCGEHLGFSLEEGVMTPQLCDRCSENEDPYTPKPDMQKWVSHKATDPSWGRRRTRRPASTKPPDPFLK